MTIQDFIGQKFATAGDGGKSAWQIVGTLNQYQLELKPIRYTNKLTYRPLLASRIGMFNGKWHMPAPKAFG